MMFALLRWRRGLQYDRRIRQTLTDRIQERPRHLLVDVSVIKRSDSRTGIQRVVRAILVGLSTMKLNGIVIQPVFATRKDAYSYCDLGFLGLDITPPAPCTKGLVSPRAGDIFLGLDLAIHLLPIHERQVRHWRSEGVSIFIIVYDLLPLRDSRWFTAKLRRRFRRWLKLLARHVDGAICISRAVSAELRDALAMLPHNGGLPRISNIQLGGDMMVTLPSTGLPQAAGAILDHVRSRPTILMVGTIEPRKGYDRVLAAFESLWNQPGSDVPLLLIVGKVGWKTDDFQRILRTHPQAGCGLFWLESVSDEFLDQLYNAATSVLMASHAEGCGLPILEALAHRRPVLARDLAVFREMDLPGVSFFRDDSPPSLAASITSFMDHAQKTDSRDFDYDPWLWSDTTLSLINIICAAHA